MVVDVALLPAHPVLLLSCYSIHVMATGTELVFSPTHDLCGFIQHDTSACFSSITLATGLFATAIPNNVPFPSFMTNIRNAYRKRGYQQRKPVARKDRIWENRINGRRILARCSFWAELTIALH
ncbi:hypothetical protein F5B18DRAFT_43241 [Nemania serpens]|nr:hypothetical protein F5B18DRAFT_43241 [Nemania serpens]